MTDDNTPEPPDSIEGYFDCLPDNLRDECAAMSHFICAGRYDFGLSGPQLDEFIAASIKAVIAAGGWPVVFVEKDGFWWWTPDHQWGGTADEIAANLLKEWHARGAPDLRWEGAYPFRSPDLFGSPFRL